MGSYKDKTKNGSSLNTNKLLMPNVNFQFCHQKDGGVVITINPEIEQGVELSTFALAEDGKPSTEDSDFSLWMYPIDYYNYSGPKALSYASMVKDQPEARSAFDVFHDSMYKFIKDNPVKAPTEWRSWIVKTAGKGAILDGRPKSGCFIQGTLLINKGKKVPDKFGTRTVLIGSKSVRDALENLANTRNANGDLQYPNLVNSKGGAVIRITKDENSEFNGYKAEIVKNGTTRDPKKVKSDWMPWDSIINFMTVPQQISLLRVNFGAAAIGFIFRDDPDFNKYLTQEDLKAWPALQAKERAKLRLELEAAELEDSLGESSTTAVSGEEEYEDYTQSEETEEDVYENTEEFEEEAEEDVYEDVKEEAYEDAEVEEAEYTEEIEEIPEEEEEEAAPPPVVKPKTAPQVKHKTSDGMMQKLAEQAKTPPKAKLPPTTKLAPPKKVASAEAHIPDEVSEDDEELRRLREQVARIKAKKK